MDAIKFILREHRKIRATFKKVKQKKTIEAKKKLFMALCQYLVMHETMEHQRWYPHFKNNKLVAKIVKGRLAEEKQAASVIKQFKKDKFSDAMWQKKFIAFNKAVDNHASHEEKFLFPKVRKILDKSELSQIGKKLQAFKKARNKTGL